MDWAAEVSHEQLALEVLIGMTAKTLCRRSNSHLENALLLVEVTLGHANLHWSMLQEQYLSKKAAEAKKAEAAADAKVKQLREAEAKEKEAEAAQADQQMQPTADTASASGAAAQPAASTTATSGSAQKSTAVDKAPEPSTRAGEAGSTAGAAAQPDAKTGGAPPAAGASSSGADAELPIPELNQQDDPGLVIQNLPEHLLKQLARLLGQSGLSELAQKRCASVIRMLVDMCPQLKPMMLSELQNELQRWAPAPPCIPTMDTCNTIDPLHVATEPVSKGLSAATGASQSEMFYFWVWCRNHSAMCVTCECLCL